MEIEKRKLSHVFHRLYIRLSFAYAVGMGWVPAIRPRQIFVVACKRCARDIPTGLNDFPRGSIRVKCPLCGELRQYRIGDVFLGIPNHLIAHQHNSEKR